VNTLNGLNVVETLAMVDHVEDWSGCRSPSRALRRRKQGHPQRVVVRAVPKKEAVQIGNTLYMHPTLAAELRRQLSQDVDAFTFRGFLFGSRMA